MLISVLAVLFILLTVFLSALTYCLARYDYHIKERNRLVAANLSEAGVQRCLSNLRSSIQFGSQDSIRAPNGGSFITVVSAWGPYLLLLSDGSFANQTVRSSAIVGSSSPPLFDAAITVCDENFPLVASGYAQIVGDVNTGPLGMTEGRIKGKAPVYENYHMGDFNIFQTLDPPYLDSTVMNQYLLDLSLRKANTETVYLGSRIFGPDDLSHLSARGGVSIENNLVIKDLIVASHESIRSVFVGGFVEISGDTKLSGLFEIVAGGPIYLHDSAVIDEAILYSEDSIIISKTATFSGTAISSTRISVCDEAQLIYPSLLYLRGKSGVCEGDCGIYLSSRAELESNCYMELNSLKAEYNDFLLFLDPHTQFTGYIVTNGRADIRGTVLGSIVADRFHYYSVPTTYVNWVSDLYLNRDLLDYSPVMPILAEIKHKGAFRILRQESNL